MPYADIAFRKAYDRARSKVRRKTHLRVYRPEQDARLNREYRVRTKLAALTRCGKNGTLQCCWPDCPVIDIDILTLDHVHDNGAKHRRESKLNNTQIYLRVIRADSVEDYQTLCFNHQWKKEMLRLREAYGTAHS